MPWKACLFQLSENCRVVSAGKSNFDFFSLILENSIDRNQLDKFMGDEKWKPNWGFTNPEIIRSNSICCHSFFFLLRCAQPSIQSPVDFPCASFICLWSLSAVFAKLRCWILHTGCGWRVNNLSHQANVSKLNLTNVHRCIGDVSWYNIKWNYRLWFSIIGNLFSPGRIYFEL